jgi:hypothetical protein
MPELLEWLRFGRHLRSQGFGSERARWAQSIEKGSWEIRKSCLPWWSQIHV